MISLQSLRVDLDGNSSGYVSAIVSKIKADEAAIDSAEKLVDANGNVYTSTDTVTSAVNTSTKALDSLRRQLDPNFAAASSLARAHGILQANLDRGRISQDTYAATMALATQRFDDATKKASPLEKAFDGIKDKAAELGRELGPAGQALATIGPLGIGIGAGIGVAVLALDKLKEMANEAGAWASSLQNAANVIGLNTTELQSLNEAAAKVGVSANDNVSAFERFAVSLGQLKDGSGSLYSELTKINPALGAQLSIAKDAATGWNILAQAYASADKQQQALLGRAAFGRGGAAQGGVLLATANAGGISGLVAANQLDTISTAQIAEWAKLKTEIDSATEAASHNFQSIFTTEILQRQKNFADNMLDISRTAKNFAFSDDWNKFVAVMTGPTVTTFLSNLAKALPATSLVANAIAGVNALTSRSPAAAPSPANFQSPANSYSSFQGGGAQGSSTGPGSAAYEASRLKDLVSALGGAATAWDQYRATVAASNAAVDQASKSADTDAIATAKAVAARVQDNASLSLNTTLQSLRNTALGAGATIADQVAAKNNALAKSLQQGGSLTETEIANTKRLNQAQADGTFALQAQIDATKAQTASIGMSIGQAEAFSLVQTKINENLNAGRPALDGVTEAYRKMADAAGQAKQEQAEANAQNKSDFDLQTAGLDGIEKQIAQLNFQLHGNKWKDFMNDGLSVTTRLADSTKQLNAATAQFGSDLLSGALQAQDAWKKMADQVISFNSAAAGFDLGPLTQALQSLAQAELTLATAAYNAHDNTSLASIQNTFNQGVVRLVNEFKHGSEVLTPYAQAVKDLNDEAQGLIDTLNSENLQGAAGAVAAALPDRVAALTKQYTDNPVTDLTDRLNTAKDQDYLNSASALVAQHNADTLSAQQLGVSMDLVNATFAAGAQKIVNDAGLTGSAFDDFIAKFPILSGVVTEASAAIARSAADIASARLDYQDQLFNLLQDQTTLAGQLAVFDRKADEDRAAEIAKGGQALVDLEALQSAQRLDIIKKFNDEQLQAAQQAADQFKSFLTQFTNTIRTYLDGLTGGSGSPLSPADRLAAAQASYNFQLALAQGGDQTAAGNITQYASNLLDAAKSFYASTTGFQTIFAQVQSQLGALPGQISATQQIVNAIATQTKALQTAFAPGDATAIATALLPSFDSLNIAAGSGLTFSQFSSLASGLASQSTLASVFSTLDTDGDGQISRLEAIKGATASTNTNIGSASGTNTLVASTNNVAAVVNQLLILSGNTLPNISTATQSTSNSALYLVNINTTLVNIYNALTTSNGTNDQLNRIRANQGVELANWGRVGNAGVVLTGFATGTNFAPVISSGLRRSERQAGR